MKPPGFFFHFWRGKKEFPNIIKNGPFFAKNQFDEFFGERHKRSKIRCEDENSSWGGIFQLEKEAHMGLGPSYNPISIFLVNILFFVGTAALAYWFGSKDAHSSKGKGSF